MRLNKSTEYCLKIVIALQDREVKGGDVLAKEVGTSIEFVQQLVRKLRTNNVVTSVRGPGGGYTLVEGANPTVLDIVKMDLGELEISDKKIHDTVAKALSGIQVFDLKEQECQQL